ncbi:PREDICTED: vacuolar protein sorting-associated protein 37A-like [Amphimedon queenslandica]|uniref:VPS37 C-terminal domain-containing protein n=1 Tax=Amphimedon queenslandica TaxID=400682 RepID=A0A1X7U3B1_AMPQE|nr:PREDICTED: vacuolar protein sorting-associated protein 37A-like [Amphimedon queenslandica]|eukprot:XP_003389105.1 PREDICTED: vacuolar protein sorting-associated protein 37A-like [Amphimedon queenslandica]
MWLFGRSSTSDSVQSSVSEATHAERQRNKQLVWLKEEIKDVAELERDRRYRASFTVQGKAVTLEIFLSDRFPLEGPVVTASPYFTHPWVDQQMRVIGCPLLQQFTVHSNLGTAIKQVIDELTTHPPLFDPPSSMASYPVQPPIPVPYSGPGPSSFVPPTSTGPFSPSFAPFSYSSMPQPVPMPSNPSPPVATRGMPSSSSSSSSSSISRRLSYSIPEKMPGISDKSNEELEKYLNDEDSVVLIDQYISKLDVIKRVQSEMESLFQENEELSKQNIDKEPTIQSQWSSLQEKHIELQSLKERYDKIIKKQSQLVEKYDSARATMQLKTLSQETDTNSDIIADDFLEQKMDCSSYLQKFLQERKLYHLRSAKLEMLKYQRS